MLFKPPEELLRLQTRIDNGELQYLDNSVLEAEQDEDGGNELSDYLYLEGMHFFSDKFKRFLDSCGVKNIFYKQIKVKSLYRNQLFIYWLAVVPRIDCLDVDNSEIKSNEWNLEDSFFPQVEVKKVVLVEKYVGNYKLFRIFGVAANDLIYCTEDFYRNMSKLKTKGMDFLKI